MFEEKTWVIEKKPLGPPADAKKATPIGKGLNDLEERIAEAFEDAGAGYLDARNWVGRTPTSADRGTQLNEALTASFEDGRGLVLPPWELTVSEPGILESFRALIGHPGASKIKVGPGSNCAALKTARFGAGGSGGGTERSAIYGVDFDGNFAGNPSVTEAVVDLDGIRMIVQAVHVKNGYENLATQMSREKSPGTSVLEDGIFRDIGLLDPQVCNFNFEGPHDSQMETILCRSNDGVNVLSNGTAPVWTNLHVYGNCEYGVKGQGIFHGLIAEGAEKGQVLILADSSKFFDFWLFDGGGADGKIGFVFGDATHSASSCLLQGGRIENCINGPLSFPRSGANSIISCLISGASGNIATGTPSPRIFSEGIHVTGGCVDNLNFRQKSSQAKVELPTIPMVEILGTTTIEELVPTYAGHKVTLLFEKACTVKNGNNLKLGADFSAAAGSTLSLACNGTNFYPA